MITIIAEVGINANGDIEIAKQLMDMARECGADLVKFQKRTVNTVYSQEELLKPRESPWGSTQGAQKRGLEFGLAQYEEIDAHSRAIGLPWSASAWDMESLQVIEDFAPAFHKVASPMITNLPFVEAVAKCRRLTYVSTGGCRDFCAIDKTVNIFRYHDCPIVLLHCIMEYPCPPEASNLFLINTLAQRYPGVSIGFSSHAVSPIVGAFAVLIGAVVIEAHITLDRSMYGSDQSASLEREGLKKLVDYCRIAEVAKGDGVKRMTEQELINAKKMRYWEVS